MATGRGINPNSVFTRTDPADAAQKIPNQTTDDQAGYDVRTADWWGIKIRNETEQVVAYEVHGYTFEDAALAEPIVLRSGSLTAGDVTPQQDWVTSRHDAAEPRDDRVARLQVQLDPAAAATGAAKIVFQSDHSD
jgi:hypothetical protein